MLEKWILRKIAAFRQKNEYKEKCVRKMIIKKNCRQKINTMKKGVQKWIYRKIFVKNEFKEKCYQKRGNKVCMVTTIDSRQTCSSYFAVLKYKTKKRGVKRVNR